MSALYSRILVALDAEGVAAPAVRHAIGLARAFEAELRLVHVVDPYGADGSRWTNPAAHEKGLAQIRQRSLDMLSAAVHEATGAGARASSAVIELDGGADVSVRLVAEANAWKADLIVLGTHGRRGIERLALGSVAEAVARTASVPALLVRETATH